MGKLITMGLCMALLTVTSSAFAESVAVTKNGKRYHEATCPLIKDKNPATVDMKLAVEKGLKPCSKCFSNKPVEGKKTKTNNLTR